MAKFGPDGFLPGTSFLPYAKSSNKRVVVGTEAPTRRQIPQFRGVAPANYNFVRFKSGPQALQNVGDIAKPPFHAVLFQPGDAEVVFKGGLFVRQVPKLQRLDDAIHDQGGPEA